MTRTMTGWRGRALVAALMLAGGALLAAEPVPSEAELKKLLGDKPINADSWKDWKDRLSDWAADPDKAQPAFEEASKYLRGQLDAKAKSLDFKKGPLQADPVAYVALGAGYLVDPDKALKASEKADKAQKAFDAALKKKDLFKGAEALEGATRYLHGLALVRRERARQADGEKGAPDGGKLKAALSEFEVARRLAPTLKMLSPKEEAQVAVLAKDMTRAEAILTKAWNDNKDDAALARELAYVFTQASRKPEDFKPLLDRFPKDGQLAARMGYAAYKAGDKKGAGDWLKRSRDLGANPATVLEGIDLGKVEGDIKKEADKSDLAEKKAREKELEDSVKRAIQTGLASAQPEKVPTGAELQKMLLAEPLNPSDVPGSLPNWLKWRRRLHEWCVKDFAATRPAFDAAVAFLGPMQEGRKDIKGALHNDPVAYLVLAMVYLDRASKEAAKVREAEIVIHLTDKVLGGMWESAKVGQPQLARAHLTRGRAVELKEKSKPRESLGHVDAGQLDAAFKEYDAARKEYSGLPGLPSAVETARTAREAGARRLAEERFKTAYEAKPDEGLAAEYARAVSGNDKDRAWLPRQHEAIKPLVDKFPKNGELLAWYGYTLQLDGKFKEAVEQWDEAKRQGTDVGTFVDQKVIDHTQKNAEGFDGVLAAPVRWFWTAVWWVTAFSIFYGSVMLLMCLGGLVLASKTKGPKAADMLGAPPDKLVGKGQALRTRHETWLTRFYMIALTLALILFYVSVPFVIWGLLIVFLIILALSFFMRRDYESASMHSAMMRASGGGIWAVIKGLFAGFSQKTFGVKKDEDDCPRLYAMLREVAQRVDTEPVDEVYLDPGASIGVKQLGRGPFGLLGRKKRVLILGVSTMHFLTVSELKAILAHEYAHFSHSDTFYSRFIYQVSLAIGTAMRGMAESGGVLTYFNPFYWFLWCYSRSYALLASGFSRSREFLADRMACSLYGGDVFIKGLEKVVIDGGMFASSIYENLVNMLKQKKAWVNMYLAYRKWHGEAITQKDRQKIVKRLSDEEPSVFDSHPTYKERLEAVKALPKADKKDDASAITLFEEPEEIEKELTDWLTEIVDYVRKQRR